MKDENIINCRAIVYWKLPLKRSAKVFEVRIVNDDGDSAVLIDLKNVRQMRHYVMTVTIIFGLIT